MSELTTNEEKKANTDVLGMNSTRMFAEIRAGIGLDRFYTQNLLECYDDMLYAWDIKNASLLTLNWRAAKSVGPTAINYQQLMPSIPLYFEVERLVCSTNGSQIALAGPRGFATLEFPLRWGKHGLYSDGKDKIICNTISLETQLFGNNPHLELRQLRWHPDSPTDSHFLVLFSDNTIRVYNNSLFYCVWQVGPTLFKLDSTLNASLSNFEEVVVDFDIAPAIKKVDDESSSHSEVQDDVSLVSLVSLMDSLVDSFADSLVMQRDDIETGRTSITPAKNEKKKTTSPKKKRPLEWPIVLLRENGNIYVLMTSLYNSRCRLQGPLTITPAARQNYGLDSCSLLVMPTFPITLVISETNGDLHHALLMELESNEFEEVCYPPDEHLLKYPSEFTVHVPETMQLQLGLLDTSSRTQGYKCPIFLKKDFEDERRYFAYHDYGLHIVSINFINELMRICSDDAVANDINIINNPSHAEYILCTKTGTNTQVNGVLGFVTTQMPCSLIMLLASGEVISLKLVVGSKFLMSSSTKKAGKDETNSNKTLTFQMPNSGCFVEHIRNILKRENTQPILSLDKSNNSLTPEQLNVLLLNAWEVLKSEYLRKHDIVRAEFDKRIYLIKLQKEQQKRDIENLERAREEIQDKAHILAERYEEVMERHEVILKKSETLLYQLGTRLPCNTVADKENAREIERINKATKNLQHELKRARDTMNKNQYHINKLDAKTQSKRVELPERHETAIKEVLKETAAEIDQTIKDIKSITRVINI